MKKNNLAHFIHCAEIESEFPGFDFSYFNLLIDQLKSKFDRRRFVFAFYRSITF